MRTEMTTQAEPNAKKLGRPVTGRTKERVSISIPITLHRKVRRLCGNRESLSAFATRAMAALAESKP